MNSIAKKKALTFGTYIATVYEVCGSRRGIAIVERAVNAHLVKFRNRQRYLIC